MGHPKYGRLVANWRLDGNFRDCKWTEFADRTGSSHNYTYSAITPAKSRFSTVSDNDTFRYKLTTAYVRDTHILYQWLSRSHIINNSDLIYIGGITAASDGSLSFVYPDNDVLDLRASGVKFLRRDGERTCVYEFPTVGPGMHVGNGLVSGSHTDRFTIEANFSLSADCQNATLFENDNISMRLVRVQDRYKAFIQIGSDCAFSADLPAINKNEYFWLDFVLQQGSSRNFSSFYFNGFPLQTAAAKTVPVKGGPNAVIGKNLAGKIDGMRIWHSTRNPSQLGAVIQPAWADRITLSISRSTGNAGITVSASENTLPEKRAGTIRLAAVSARQECVCIVTQEGRPQYAGENRP